VTTRTFNAAEADPAGAGAGAAGLGRAVVLSGTGRFADAWHPFAGTSARLAAILRDQGFDPEIAGPDERMADLGDARLVVVNIGAPSAPDPAQDAAGRQGLLGYLERGGPLLVMHVSSTSLPAVPEWKSVLGGIWVRGTTMHPDYGLARIHLYPDRHPVVAPATDFELYDERYSYLDVAPGVVPLATHRHDGIEHPLLWAWSYPPGDPGTSHPRTARVIYDALGHDERSYDSPGHREIIARAARWLVADLGG
jgi:type 1 glutamine amidotransferase